jgi:hypothetical protein
MKNLFCIDLDQPTLEGFRKFISAWLYRGERFTLLVDPGPLSTIPHLICELRRHKVERLGQRDLSLKLDIMFLKNFISRAVREGTTSTHIFSELPHPQPLPKHR